MLQADPPLKRHHQQAEQRVRCTTTKQSDKIDRNAPKLEIAAEPQGFKMDQDEAPLSSAFADTAVEESREPC